MVDDKPLDKFDIAILSALQKNADLSMSELGDTVGLSHTPCWRRVKRLQDQGYITNKVTLLAPEALNLGVSVHAYLTIKHHDEASLTAFENAVADIPQIVECYSTSGDKDYLLRVVVSSVGAYETFLKKTLAHHRASVNVH